MSKKKKESNLLKYLFWNIAGTGFLFISLVYSFCQLMLNIYHYFRADALQLKSKELVIINALCLVVSYVGLKAKEKLFPTEVSFDMVNELDEIMSEDEDNDQEDI